MRELLGQGEPVLESGPAGMLHNGAFIAAFMGFLFAQVAKVFTHW